VRQVGYYKELKYCFVNFLPLYKKMCKLGCSDMLLLKIVHNSASRRESHELGQLCEHMSMCCLMIFATYLLICLTQSL